MMESQYRWQWNFHIAIPKIQRCEAGIQIVYINISGVYIRGTSVDFSEYTEVYVKCVVVCRVVYYDCFIQ